MVVRVSQDMSCKVLAIVCFTLIQITSAHSFDQSTFSSFNDFSLVKRDSQSGGPCGPTAGNANCAAGLCCGPNGVCGTGGYFCDAPACLIQYGPACDGNVVPKGNATSNVPRPQFGAVPYGVSLVNCTQPGYLAISLDDGPYLYTSQVLDILKSNGIPATFFVVANNGGKGEIDITAPYPDIIRRMILDGHQVGSHSFSHQDLTQITAQERHDQIVKNEVVLTNILGFFPTYLRPPYMDCNAPCLADLLALGYHVMNYNIDTLDWQGNYTASEQIFLNAIKSTTPTKSFVPLAHDIHQDTVTTFVPYMISQAQKLGYKFTTIGECLGDPPSNWYRDPITGQPVSDPVALVSALVNGAKPSQVTNTATSSAGDFGDASTPTSTITNAPTKSNSSNSTTHSTKNDAMKTTPVLNLAVSSFSVAILIILCVFM